MGRWGSKANRKDLNRATTALVFGVLTACDGRNPDTNPAESAEQHANAEVAAIEKRLARQEEMTNELRDENERLRSDLSQIAETASEANTAIPKMRMVTLRPGDDNYRTLSWDLGRMTVALIAVERHSRGARVTLRIGNPLYARLYRVKANLAYGEVDSQGQPVGKTLETRRALLTEYVGPGTWKLTRLVLDGVTADSLGYVSVGNVEVETVSLQRQETR